MSVLLRDGLLAIAEAMRRMNFIKPGEMKLDL